MYFACALHSNLPASFTCWVQVTPCFSPLQGLRVSRYPGGEAYPGSHRVGNWLVPHPTSTIKLSKYNTLPRIPRVVTVSRERVARLQLEQALQGILTCRTECLRTKTSQAGLSQAHPLLGDWVLDEIKGGGIGAQPPIAFRNRLQILQR